MAVETILAGRSFSDGQPGQTYRRMSAYAHLDVMLFRLRASRNVVRIMALDARHLTVLETRRFAQAISGAGDLEFFVMTRAFGMIEEDEVVAERLSGPV